MTSLLEFWPELLDTLFEGAYILDPDRTIWHWNRAAETITGFAANEVVGSSCARRILAHTDEDGNLLCDSGCPITRALETGEIQNCRMYLRHKNGHRLPVQVRAVPVYRDQKVIGAVEFFHEANSVSAARQRLRELEKLALIDPLTGIGNRRYGESNLNIRRAELHRYGWPYGVIYLDIDRFKKINDELGHEAGDRVLRMVADSLVGSLRPFDAVCRWGGEEFLLILSNAELGGISIVAERIRRMIEASGIDNGDSEKLSVTVSAGATQASEKDKPDDLVARADALMYEAKKAGRNTVRTG
ncbi:sensor domain-containing diguanylate cyclase [Candidatus Fermentibacterales bacterium]|nr:sensor domain-containing diguanylate cyclase [Candidatus Fermentibacterales bacterium]